MTAPTVTQQKTIEKTVAGKTVTLTPEQAEEFGRETRRAQGARDRRPRRARHHLHPADHQGAARFRGRRPGTALRWHLPAVLARGHRDAGAVEDPRQHGDRPQRHARPVRLDGRSGVVGQEVRMGHRLPGRPVAPFAQLHAPHLHQHRRHGPRHRLRHPADERGPALEPVLPGQPGLRLPADGAVPIRRRAARVGDRAHPRRARSPSRTSARSSKASGARPRSRR